MSLPPPAASGICWSSLTFQSAADLLEPIGFSAENEIPEFQGQLINEEPPGHRGEVDRPTKAGQHSRDLGDFMGSNGFADLETRPSDQRRA